MRCAITAFIAACWILTAGAARAQGTDAAAAEALFDQGQQAKKAGDYRTACAKFAESERLDRAAGTLLNLADCEERLSALADAWQHWREAIGLLPPGDDRIPVAKQRLAALDPRVPHLTLTLAPSAPAGAVVVRDGVALGAASLGVPLPVNPGPHTLIVKAPGAADAVQTVTVAEGASGAVTLEAGAPGSAPASSGGTRRAIGFALGGLGAAGFIAAAVTGAMLPGKRDIVSAHCVNKVCDQTGLDAASAGQKLLTANTAMWVVGYAGVGAGAVLVATSWIGDKPATVGASVGPGHAGVSFTGSF